MVWSSHTGSVVVVWSSHTGPVVVVWSNHAGLVLVVWSDRAVSNACMQLYRLRIKPRNPFCYSASVQPLAFFEAVPRTLKLERAPARVDTFVVSESALCCAYLQTK
jgi:hypothetical protein